MKILIVEDDQLTREFLATLLRGYRYTVDIAIDGETGFQLATLWHYDAILLDLQLPKLDGLSLCRQLRYQQNNTPILMLTAKRETEDIIAGLDSGADDYVTKPYEPRQLIARLRALLRREGTHKVSSVLRWEGLCLDPISAKVTYQNKPIVLCPQEYNLLALFLRNPQRVFNRNAILDNLWKADKFPADSAVTNLIKNLRRKLKEGGLENDCIETVYGLGYRLKSLESQVSKPENTLPQDSKNISNNCQKGLFLIEELAQKFRKGLQERIIKLEENIKILAEDNIQFTEENRDKNGEKWQEIREEIHRLAGSLGTYGYTRGSELARSMEQCLTDSSQLGEIDLIHLRQYLSALCTETKSLTSQRSSDYENVDSVPFILGINVDDNLRIKLQQEAPMWGLEFEFMTDQNALNYLEKKTPSVILLKIQGGSHDGEGLRVLRCLKQQLTLIPIVILAEKDSLENRIQAGRIGSEKYMVEPINLTQVFEVLIQLLSQTTIPQAKVLIVDDDPLIIKMIKNLLHPWGLEGMGLTNPSQFWQVVQQFRPDLLLLDISLPNFSGLELCQVVRQDVDYADLPILVITAHREIEYIQQAFEAGADDLILKPIIEPELVARVLSRLERARLRQQINILRQQQSQDWQEKARLDALTQIPNRLVFDEVFEQQWQYHLQERDFLSLILCDVDLFKSYNDHYGHLAGDFCLQQVANTLRECLKSSEDVVARYGGEEFAVILPHTDLRGALQVAQRIRQAITALKIARSDSPVSQFVTLSMGISGTVPSEQLCSQCLIERADQALYVAKDYGRNTYCIFPLT